MLENNTDGVGRMENKLFDLNARPQRMHGQTSNNQVPFVHSFSFFFFEIVGVHLLFYVCIVDLNNLCITWKTCFNFFFKEQGMEISGGTNDCASVVPVGVLDPLKEKLRSNWGINSISHFEVFCFLQSAKVNYGLF